MTRIDSSSLMAMRSAILQQNGALQKAASAPIAAPAATTGVGQADFTKALSSALGNVNAAQTRAADFLLGTGDVDGAFTRLLDVVRRTAGEDRDLARKHLVELFGIVGDDDPRVGPARRALMSALF